MIRYIRKMALEESKAPVNNARMSPECFGKAFDSWKLLMNTKGPPRARKRYPGVYPSKGKSQAKAKNRHPRVSQKLPITPQTRGPKLSRIAPIGRAATFVPTAATRRSES